MKNPSLFRRDLERLINRNSAENGCDTPDFVLAKFLVTCLAAFDEAVMAREHWYGRQCGGGKAIAQPNAGAEHPVRGGEERR